MSRVIRGGTRCDCVVEISQNTRYIGTTFRRCDFSGVGPVTFEHCAIDRMSSANLMSTIARDKLQFIGVTQELS